MLSAQIIIDLLKRQKTVLPSKVIESEAKKLDHGFVLSQALDPRIITPEVGVDFIVILSGRSDFKRKYLENPERPPNARDLNETRRRMMYAIALAKYCTSINKLNGVDKPVKIYFNGIPKVNNQLLRMLRLNDTLRGYPSKWFIVDNIPIVSTIGQVIGLSKFLLDNQDVPESPNIILTTSTYHLYRSAKAFGNSSPLHSPDFYLRNSALTKKLPLEYQRYVSSPGNKLKNARINIFGCDRFIAENPGWNIDLKGDMEATFNYSSLQNPPSISKNFPSNIVTISKAMMKYSLFERRQLTICDKSDNDETEKKAIL